MKQLITTLFALILFCSIPGRVLHVDNKKTIPYSAEDFRLKKRIVKSLIRHRLINAEQRYTCQVNIMRIGYEYYVEVFPDGVLSKCRFGVRMKKLMLRPVERYIDCPGETENDTAADSLHR